MTDPAEAKKVIAMMPLKYADAPPQVLASEMPKPADVALFRVAPRLVSVLDYALGFGHTDPHRPTPTSRCAEA